MQKLRLEVEQLEVDALVMNDALEKQGTVHGQESWMDPMSETGVDGWCICPDLDTKVGSCLC